METKKENVRSKLQLCRHELCEAKLKKSGKNPFAKFDYFTLDDFMPVVNSLFNKHGLFSQFNITDTVDANGLSNRLATLDIYNTDSDEEPIHFSSPVADASVKGCSAIQAIGSAITYMRRYLYMTALEISEPDLLDAEVGSKDHPPVESKPIIKSENVKESKEEELKITEDQAQMIRKLHLDKLINLPKILGYYHVESVEDLPIQIGSQIISKYSKKEETENGTEE